MDYLGAAPADVQATVGELRDGIAEALGPNLVGLYLTGSLSYGDFDVGSSDIDYLAVLHQSLTLADRFALIEVHHAVAKRHPRWRERIEGSYVTIDMLPSVDPPTQPRPYVNQGAFWNPDPQYGSEWLINRHVLQECSVPLVGPTFSSLVRPVEIELVRAASAKDLFTAWLSQIDDPAFLPDSHHEAYVTLTMCRILHRQFNEEVASKCAAAAWVRPRVPEHLGATIDSALTWQHGENLGRRDEVIEFIQFVASALHDSDNRDDWTRN